MTFKNKRHKTGWPQHKENREFGIVNFPYRENTGNLGTTQGKLGQRREFSKFPKKLSIPYCSCKLPHFCKSPAGDALSHPCTFGLPPLMFA